MKYSHLAPEHRLRAIKTLDTAYPKVTWGGELRKDQSLQDIESIGGGNRTRTGDPLLAKQVLFQLSYTPNLLGLE